MVTWLCHQFSRNKFYSLGQKLGAVIVPFWTIFLSMFLTFKHLKPNIACVSLNFWLNPLDFQRLLLYPPWNIPLISSTGVLHFFLEKPIWNLILLLFLGHYSSLKVCSSHLITRRRTHLWPTFSCSHMRACRNFCVSGMTRHLRNGH